MKRLILAALAALLFVFADNSLPVNADSVSPSQLVTQGTWTPAFTFGGNCVGCTYGAATLGTWSRVGNIVVAIGEVTLTSKGSSTGSWNITGLPFTSAAVASQLTAVAVGYCAGTASVTGACLGMVAQNNTTITLYHSNNGAALGLTNSNATNTSAIYFTATYLAK